MINNVLHLVKKDFRLELRSLYMIGGVVLFVCSAVFIIYKSFNVVEPRIWNALFWIIFLFVGANATLNNYFREKGQKAIFYYQIVGPTEVLISKVIINFFILIFLASLIFILMALLLSNPVKDLTSFYTTIMVVCIGMAINFGFVSAIASHGKQNGILMSILSFPILIPLLLIGLKLTANAMRIINDSDTMTDYIILHSINLIMLGFALNLFPQLWKS